LGFEAELPHFYRFVSWNVVIQETVQSGDTFTAGE
jgi:hypothetical protein